MRPGILNASGGVDGAVKPRERSVDDLVVEPFGRGDHLGKVVTSELDTLRGRGERGGW